MSQFLSILKKLIYTFFIMNCQTATKVYSSNHPLETIKQIFPEAWSFFESESQNLANKVPDTFDTAVKEIVGQSDFDYRVVHRDDTDTLTVQVQELLGDVTSRLLIENHFSDILGRSIYFSTVCCSGCISAFKPLNLDESLVIQKAAIKLQ
jgi:hypothetical protein